MKTESTHSVEHLYREHHLSLLRLGFLMTGSREEAEDSVQTAFAALQTRWETVDNPLAYLRQVVVNRAKDRQRRAFRAPPLASPGVTEIPEIDETFAAIVALSDTQRIVVVLHYYEGLSLVEVADILNRPQSTVRSDLRRALGHLREALS